MFRRLIKAHLEFSYRHPLGVIFFSLLLAAAGIWFSLGIRLDPNIQSLLPKNTETIRAMKETEARFGSSDLFTIAIVMNNADTVARIQDEIKSALEKEWPDVVYAQDARDNAFFEQHALLYLPTSYLQDIENKLKQVEFNLGTRSLLGVDLLDDEMPASQKSAKMEWFNAQLPQQLGLPDEAADVFTGFFKDDENKDGQPKQPKKFDPKAGLRPALRSRLMGKTPDGRTVGLVQAVLKYPSANIDYVKSVIVRSKSLIRPYQARYGNDLNIGVEGPYQALEEVNSLSRNGMIATVISVLLTVLVLLVYFRNFGSVFLMSWQAIFSCALTLGMIALTYGRLNLYTVFVISIIFGIGIDYFIYILGYAQKQVRAGKEWKQALEESMNMLSFSVAVSALTTITGLLTLLISKFVGFYEFGVIASMGVVISFLSTFLIMPSYVFAWERMRSRFPRFWPSLVPRIRKPWNIPFFTRRDPRNLIRISAALVIAITAVLACFVPRLKFEYDFNKLRDTHQKANSNRPVSVALSSRASSQPVVILANDSSVMVALHDTLLQRLTVEKDPYLRSFLTLTTFVPPTGQQQERMKYISDIGDLAGKRILDHAQGKDSVMIQKLRLLSRAQPFSSADIPKWSLNLLRERDGSYGKIGFVYGSYNSSDARETGKFQDHYGHFTIAGEHLSAYSSGFVFSDIVRLVKSDSRKMFVYMMVALLVLLTFILRSRKLLLICAIQMFVSVIWILGLMGLFQLKIGVFNLIVMTTLQDYIVDVCAILLLGYLKLGPQRIRSLYSDIGGLVTVCTLSTAASFAGMLFTSHLGIASIGKFAVLGLSALLISTLGLTPWLAVTLVKDKELQLDKPV